MMKLCAVMKWMLGGVLVSMGLLAAERPYFNNQKAPESLEDLENIEAAMKAVLPKTRAATVCLELGLEMGFGSGVIVSEEGLIMTAAHVSGGVGRRIEAVMEDGTRYPVITLGLISTTDAALAKIDGPGPFPFVELDREKTTRLGDWVLSLGHSGGFDQERGLVARLGRIVRMVNSTTWQSDGTLIGGDSGGPLFNLSGQLIGIHSRVGQTKGENLHVPVDEFLAKWEMMMKEEFVGEGPFAKRLKGLLGVKLKEGSNEIELVSEKGAAERAGLEVGDVIQRADGKAVKGIEDLKGTVMARFEGERIDVVVLRNAEELTLTVQLGGVQEKPQLSEMLEKPGDSEESEKKEEGENAEDMEDQREGEEKQ